VTSALSVDQAFAEFVEPEIELMLRVAFTLTGSWPDAEDLVQDSLVRAYRALDRFDGRYPRAWLLTVLRNAHLNSLRRKRPETTDDDGRLERARPAFGTGAAPDPWERVSEGIFEESLEAAVASLDPKFRTALLLVDVDQLSYAEVADVLGVPIGTVMSRVSRARDRVRKHLRAGSEERTKR
jgi:RNA polymerase sigma-70 factor (ECF subfamily)